MPGRLFKFWFLVFTAMQCGFRLGEATTPGPELEGPSPSLTWSLSVCNPSGLQGKTHVLATTASDVIAISDTHLTSRGRDILSRSFRAGSAHYSHLVSGAPVALRSDASDAGYYSGVAIAAHHPSRALQVPWPPDLDESCRIQFATTWCQSMWISGCVVYGYPDSKYHANALSRTNRMLDFASECLLSMQGPRFAAGDWNHEIHKLSITKVLRDAGWMEVQDLVEALTGQRPQVTCKAKTRKDFLWLSPELIPMFHDLVIDRTGFADHAILKASFHGGKQTQIRYLLPCSMFQMLTKSSSSDQVHLLIPTLSCGRHKKLWLSKHLARSGTAR